MTITQKDGAKGADYAEPGYKPGRGAAYIVFPNPLIKFTDKRIVGIKYDLVKSTGPLGSVITPEPPQPRRTAKTPPTEPESPKAHLPPRMAQRQREQAASAKHFLVTIRVRAETEISVEVAAQSRHAARESALAKARVPDLSRGEVTRTIVKVREQT